MKPVFLIVLSLAALAAGAAQDVNESQASACRVDMVGPELWTGVRRDTWSKVFRWRICRTGQLRLLCEGVERA